LLRWSAYDSVGRYGGEEFLVVAPDCGPHATWELAERIRAHIAKCNIDDAGASLKVSLSLGYAAGSSSADIERLLHEADTALYQAKNAGRNRVEPGLGESAKSVFVAGSPLKTEDDSRSKFSRLCQIRPRKVIEDPIRLDNTKRETGTQLHVGSAAVHHGEGVRGNRRGCPKRLAEMASAHEGVYEGVDLAPVIQRNYRPKRIGVRLKVNSVECFIVEALRSRQSAHETY